MGKSVYEIVTNKIIEKLEKGVVPWRKPWVNGTAVNWMTEKPYRGVNTLLLDAGEYATYKQIEKAGGKVKKGEKSHIVVFWKWLEVEDKDAEKEGVTKNVPMLRYYRVFEINTQVEGLSSKRKELSFDHDPMGEGEKIKGGYMDAPTFSFKRGGAYYQPFPDHINVPPMKDFPEIEKYYSTLFHEMIHSTGHADRLNRTGVKKVAAFGSEDYSKEELVAEMGAAMLCGVAKIDNSTIDNSAAYVQSWLRALKNDKRLVVTAAAQAQKAADYILEGSNTGGIQH